MSCLVCLDDGADVVAPCGQGGDEPQFHARCLAAVQAAQTPNYRCPHCNVPIEGGEGPRAETAATMVRWIADSWLGTPGYWIMPGRYVCVKQAMLRGAEEAEVEQAVRAALVEALGGEADQASHLSLTVVCAREGHVETALFMRRMAVVAACGTVIVDGYALLGAAAYACQEG